MDNVIKILGVAVICAVVAVIVRSSNREFSDMIKIAAAVILAGTVIVSASPLLSFLLEISRESQVSVYLTVMIKALAIAFLTHICASVCRDCGENTIASYAELAGKIEMLVIALPLIEEIIGVAKSLAEMI